MSPFSLALRLLIRLRPAVTHQTVHVGTDRQQLFHFISRPAIIGIDRFFLCQERGILRLQTLDRGELFYT